jgi:hypothetical protein
MKPVCRVVLALLLVGVGALALASPADAATKKRITVLPIDGARSSQLQRSVTRVVKKRHSVVSDAKYQRAIEDLRIRKLNTEGIAKVSGYLEVDGVIEGLLIAEDDHYVLRLRLREGASGRTVRKFSVYLKSPRLTDKLREQLADKLHAAIDTLEPLPVSDDDAQRGDTEQGWLEEDGGDDDIRGEPEEPDMEEPAPTSRSQFRGREDRAGDQADRDTARFVRDRDDTGMRARNDERAEDDDFDRADDDRDDSVTRGRRAMVVPLMDEDDGPRARRDTDRERDDGGVSDSDGPASAPRISVFVGASVVGRTLTFNAAPIDKPPLGYPGLFSPSALAKGAVYPFGPYGVGFVAESAVGLQSTVKADTMQISVPTQRSRYGVDARYRLLFGDGDSASVTMSAGFSQLVFALDRSQLPAGVVVDLPNTSYTYLDPGVELRYPLTASIALLAEAKGMLILGAGEIVTADQYGSATVLGLDGDLAAEYHVTDRIAVRAGAHLTAISYAFDGNGEQAINRDGNASTVDVAGASDRYLGGYVTAGYAY